MSNYTETIIDIPITFENEYKPQYSIALNWPKEYVLKLAEENEVHKIFTLPFYTGSVDDIPDFSDFFEYDYQYLAPPFYVKDIENIPRMLEIWGFE